MNQPIRNADQDSTAFRQVVGPGRLRLGLVGCGGIAAAHGRAAQTPVVAGRAAFVACCDVSGEAARAWSAAFSPGCAVYGDYRQMIRAERLDGVLLATWPNLHHEQILRCLDGGVRGILCEKALTTTGREAVAIWRAARDAGALVVEGFMYRHHPAILRMDELVAAGAIGRIDGVRAEFSTNALLRPGATPSARRNWRLRADCAGGVPYDLMCYAVNACGHFAGAPPTRVMGFGTIDPAYGVMLREFGLIEYADGTVGSVASSMAQQFSQELQVHGADGHLFLQVAWTIAGGVRLSTKRSPAWPEVDVAHEDVPAADSYARQLEDFVRALRGERPPLVGLAESVVDVHVSEALVTSALERRPVEVLVPADISASLPLAHRMPA